MTPDRGAAISRAGRGTFCLLSVVALMGAPAAAADADREVAAALLDLTTATAGSFGDEGPLVLEAVDALEGAVRRWDAEIAARAAATRAAASSVEAQLELSDAYLSRGRAADALAAANIAADAAPRDPAVHRQRGFALEALGRRAESADAFERAWSLGERDGLSAFLAFSGREAGGDRAAVEHAFSSAYTRCLTTPAPRWQIPGGLLNPTANETPMLPLSLYAPAYAHLARHAFTEAIAEFRLAISRDPLLVDRAVGLPDLAAGTASLRQGNFAEARRHLEAVRAAVPDSSEIHRILGLAYLVSGGRDAGLAQLATSIRLNPANERAGITMARALVDAGRPEEAEQVLLATLKHSPESRLADWWLGWVYEQVNELGEARRHLAQAARPETLAGRHRILGAIGRLARVEGDFAAIVPALEEAARAAPNDVMARKELAFALIEQDRPMEALGELVAACAIAPSDPDVHALVGRIHLDADRAGAAVPALRRALELAPSHADARYALATALVRTGDAEGAAREREIFEQASRASIESRRRQMTVDVLTAEAAVRTAEGFHDRAVALWRRVVEAEPGRASHLSNLAAAQLRAGRTVEAIDAYERSLRVEANPDIYRRLADLYARVGRHDDSRRALLMSETSPPKGGDR